MVAASGVMCDMTGTWISLAMLEYYTGYIPGISQLWSRDIFYGISQSIYPYGDFIFLYMDRLYLPHDAYVYGIIIPMQNISCISYIHIPQIMIQVYIPTKFVVKFLQIFAENSRKNAQGRMGRTAGE